MKTRTRRNQTEAFKRRAAHIMNTRGNRHVREIAHELGASESALHVWAALYRGEAAPPAEDEPSRTGYAPASRERESDEIERLTWERDRLRIEAGALRKAIVLLGRS